MTNLSRDKKIKLTFYFSIFKMVTLIAKRGPCNVVCCKALAFILLTCHFIGTSLQRGPGRSANVFQQFRFPQRNTDRNMPTFSHNKTPFFSFITIELFLIILEYSSNI